MNIKRYFRFAGIELAIVIPEEYCGDCGYRLEPFQKEEVADPYVFQFEKVNELPAPTGELQVAQPNYFIVSEGNAKVRYVGARWDDKRNAYMRVERDGRNHRVQLQASHVPGQVGGRVILETIGVDHLMAVNNGFIFHCSFIDHDGKAILFTAPSGTGKSTQADLWNRYRDAEIINGDRAAVRLVDGVLMAEGTPFAGSSEYCKNRSLPIEAIVYLGQAPVTTIRRMKGYEAFSKIWEGVSVNTWDREDLERVSAVVQKVASEFRFTICPVHRMNRRSSCWKKP